MHKRALYAITLATCALSLQAATDRITASVQPSRSTILKGHKRPEATAQNDLGTVDPNMQIDYATIYLKPAPGLEAFLAEVQNPSSPNYHRWLSPEQFGDRFGLTSNDTGKITAWLQSQGLTVHDVARGRHWITFSGAASRVGQAFHTELHRYRLNGVEHFANATDLAIPAAFQSVVNAVGGLHDFGPVPFHTTVVNVQPDSTSGSSHTLVPDDIATIYNITPLYAAGVDGTGQKVAVIGQTDINLSDIRTFRTRFNLPVNDPQIVLVGPDPGTRSNDQVEADLDVEWTGAVARNATIIYVNSRSIYTSAQYAIDQNLAPVMTLSYGGCEASTTDFFRSIAQQGSAQGITWMVSSGDWGGATCDYTSPNNQATKGLTVSYPTSIPEVTSVGGTEFNDATGIWWATGNTLNRASALSYIPEKVWSDAGGGVSSLFSKPAWQTGPGVPADGQRDVPDISFTASGHDGYQIVNNGGVFIVGGTSASSPVFAGIVALLNQSAGGPLGNINPALYRLAVAAPEAFHDTTVGDNKYPCAQGTPACVDGKVGYDAGPGYDLASGLGSIDVAQLFAKWNTGNASTITVDATPSSFTPDDRIKIVVTVSGVGGAPSGAITFLSGDTEVVTVPLVPGDKSSTATYFIDGPVLAGLAPPILALYSGDGTFLSSFATVNVALKIPSTGSFLIPSVTPNPVRQSGTSWPYTLTLTEKAGVATKVTAFTVNGVDNLSNITNPNIAAGGSFTKALAGNGLTPPIDRIFHFEGVDAGGATWKRDLTVPFLGPLNIPPRISPSISLSLAPATMQLNSNASNPDCQFTQQVSIQENSGYAVNLASFTATGVTFTSRISQLFGTTRLAPFGMLTANICYPNATAPAQRTLSVIGLTETGGSVSAAAAATFAAASPSVALFSVSAPMIDIKDTASLDLKFSTTTSKWTATALPSTQKWLTLSDTSGAGPATLNLTASASGLSKGVYNALVSISASDAVPQAIQIPVVFRVGPAGDTAITGIGNAASGAQVFAPGELVAVYGTNLAPATLSAAFQPLPYSLSGVSATVNGISAPLWFVSSGQINLQLPYETTSGTAVIGVNNNGQVSSFTFQVSPTGPGIFAFQGNTVPFASGNPGQTLVCFITGDGDVTPTLVSGATPPAGTTLANFPQPRQPLTMTIGGEQAKIVFNGIVTGLIGVTQVNFTIPADLPAGPQPVVVTVGGVSSAPVNLTVVTP